MKKILCILTVVMSISLLCSCSNSYSQNTENEQINNEESTADSTTTAGEYANASSAWLSWGNTWLPVSVVTEGVQRMQNDSDEEIWYFDAIDSAKSYTNTKPDDCHIHSIDYTASDIVANKIALSGSWEASPAEVRYIYKDTEKGTLPEHKIWDKYYKNIFDSWNNNRVETPIVYTDIWAFDLDKDGLDEYIVTACNNYYANTRGSEMEIGTPDADTTTIYSITTLFWGDGRTQELYSIIWGLTNDQNPINIEKDVYISYVNAEDGLKEEVYIGFLTYQYGKDGKVHPYPVYAIGECSASPRCYPVLADLDADGIAELITWVTGEYSPLTVYKLTQSGELVIQIKYATPA
ncbi:MAG: hypothetical protein PHO24_05290 [Clostridia bacterium]|nr:hypothetical protein [Clostridia bacterium]